ncbi:MAG: ribonuclease D, partial [Polyangiales bacterium]
MKYRFVEKNSELDEVVEAASKGAYAIDTEFVRERTYYPVLSLVQIAWPGGLVLIDPFKVDMTRLRPLMESDSLALVHACS